MDNIFVYVLKSESDGARYCGKAKDVEKRLSEHNMGKNRYTKGHMPWKVIYTGVHPEWASARKREKYLKSAGGKWLEKQLNSQEY